MNRAVLAGQLLARVLASGAHGDRPVTLIGYSMGARCALTCPALERTWPLTLLRRPCPAGIARGCSTSPVLEPLSSVLHRVHNLNILRMMLCSQVPVIVRLNFLTSCVPGIVAG